MAEQFGEHFSALQAILAELRSSPSSDSPRGYVDIDGYGRTLSKDDDVDDTSADESAAQSSALQDLPRLPATNPLLTLRPTLATPSESTGTTSTLEMTGNASTPATGSAQDRPNHAEANLLDL
eukprot:CAMPEP_0174960416 /NCGR_PEP_ID=MMETSP0004_2-20121128/3694_1 /TAXON_ID=420556 /ORGANISM="Ochromonas sp., Strain CCMP1393" /LENGTH=122 /DNA_ID=CAMNT_0016208791 /DNA_START=435 /DNA_END=803 /DNA_ORIENTATION=-